jgi:hypothetical protein
MKIKIEFDGPILSGSISTAQSRCGKEKCVCKAKKPKLHGTYYRWTGIIAGRRTTKTITRELARECEKRIQRYTKLKKQFDLLLEQALQEAPWESDTKKSRS